MKLWKNGMNILEKLDTIVDEMVDRKDNIIIDKSLSVAHHLYIRMIKWQLHNNDKEIDIVISANQYISVRL